MLHIDGDSITHRCGFGVQKTKYLLAAGSDFIVGVLDSAREAAELQSAWSKEYISKTKEAGVETQIWKREIVGTLEEAVSLVDGVMRKIRSKYETHDVSIYLTPDRGNFREKLQTYAKYKGNRDGTKRPVYIKELIAHLQASHGAVYAVGEEADDAIGIGMFSDPGRKDVCVSNDKDLDQIVGHHYNWVKDEQYDVTPKQADLNFFSQVLSGDVSDNVPGIFGMGPITARKLLADLGSSRECWECVLEQYRNHYPGDFYERALETARLVRIRRTKNELWSPPWEAISETPRSG